MTIVALPILMGGIAIGGWPYAIGVIVVLAVGAHEYGALFRTAGRRPAFPILVPGAGLVALARYLWDWPGAAATLGVLALAAMAWHVFDYERGAPASGTDFAVSLSGLVYLGWIGSYFIGLRQVPDGEWWVLLALPSVWLADGAAYIFGSRWGKWPLVPRLSPKKTWIGYLSGLVFGALGGMGFAAVWGIAAGPDSLITPTAGLAIGFLLAALTPLGDLGISMIKRENQVKDTGTILPGHGGFLDRMDTWLWAVFITYAYVQWIA